MYSKTSWKLLPLAALMALAALVLVPGASFSPQDARAAVSLDVPSDMESGEDITFELDLDEGEGEVTITVSGADTSDITLTLTTCECDEETDDDNGDGEASLTIDTDDSNFDGDQTVVFSLDVDCDEDDTLLIEVDEEGGGSDSEEIDCSAEGSSAGGNVVVINDEDSDDVDVDFSISGDASCDDDFSLGAGDEEGFDCDLNDTYTIRASLSGDDTAEISCQEDGEAETTIDEDEGEVVVELTDNDEDSVECTFTIESDGGGSGSGTPSSVTVSAGPNSVNCSGSSFITVVVKNAQGGNVPNGTSVQASTTLGSVNPTNATTQDGGVLILFTAPSNQGGNATITARAGSVQNTTTVNVNCAQAQPTQAPPPPPPPAGGTGGIRPPATGDAGLADRGGASYAGIGIALIVSAVLGGLAVQRVRA
jgi:hypothetical protein